VAIQMGQGLKNRFGGKKWWPIDPAGRAVSAGRRFDCHRFTSDHAADTRPSVYMFLIGFGDPSWWNLSGRMCRAAI